MKTYGSTTGTAHQIKNFYGAVDHKARLALKVYGPAPTPDSFDTLTIQSGGIGNITGTNPTTFTTHVKEADPEFWNDIVIGNYIPLRIEATRSGSSFLRIKKLTFIYRHSDSSAEYSYSLLSYTSSSDTNYKDGLARYGFSYKSSLSNGTDVINFTMGYVTKTKLIHKGFAKPDWGEATFYPGYKTVKSLQYAPGSSDPASISSINFTTFANFISNNNIDTSGQVEFVGASTYANRYWVFPKVGGGTVQVSQSSLNSTTGITGSSYTTQHLYFVFFDKHIVNSSASLTTKKLLSGDELDTLCVNCDPSRTPMYNVEHTIGGEQVVAGSITKFVFGSTPGVVGNNFLSNDTYLWEIDATKWRVNTIGSGFLSSCTNLISGNIIFPSELVSLGSSFLYYCRNFNGTVSFNNNAKIKTINSSFMSNCSRFNHPISLPNNITSIATSFMYTCSMFNSSLSLPSSITSIGTNFLSYCYAFNKPITLPSSLTQIGSGFMSDMRDMVSTVTCEAPATVATTSNYTLCAYNSSSASYTTGITLAGTYASDWHSRFPDRTSSVPYRKTIVA